MYEIGFSLKFVLNLADGFFAVLCKEPKLLAGVAVVHEEERSAEHDGAIDEEDENEDEKEVGLVLAGTADFFDELEVGFGERGLWIDENLFFFVD